MTATADQASETAAMHAPTVFIQPKQLLNVLANALLFAGSDRSLAFLAAVRLSVKGAHLVGRATDRNIIAEVRGQLGAGSDETFTALIPAEEVRQMLPELRAAAKARHAQPEVRLAVHDGGLEWQMDGQTRMLGVQEGEYPNLETIMARSAEAILDGNQHDPETQWVLDPQHLAAIAKIRDLTEKGARQLGRLTLIPHSSPRKPLLWHMGDYARGLIMPVHLTNPKTVRDLIAAWDA